MLNPNKENHPSTKHGTTGHIVEYLAHLEQMMKTLEAGLSKFTQLFSNVLSQ